jgi:hypothetical protein
MRFNAVAEYLNFLHTVVAMDNNIEKHGFLDYIISKVSITVPIKVIFTGNLE